MMRPSGSVTPPAGSELPGLSWAKSGPSAAGDVQRQEAVVAVIAVEEPALLAAVHLVVGRVDIQHQPGRRLALPQIDEQLHELRLQRIRIVADPVVAVGLTAGGRMLEAVQRALACQRCAALPPTLKLARQQGQQRIVPQVVVVVEVLVPQGDARDALRHQCPKRVFREAGVAVILEARSPHGRRAPRTGRSPEAAAPRRST